MAIEHWVTLVPDTKALEKGYAEFVDKAKSGATVEVKTDPAQARKAGEEAGKAVDRGVQDATKDTGTKVGTKVGQDVKTSGTKTAKTAGQEIAEAIGGEIGRNVGEWAKTKFPRVFGNLSAAGEALGSAGARAATEFGTKFAQRAREAIATRGLKAAGASAASAIGSGLMEAASQNFQPLNSALDGVDERARSLQSRLGDTFAGTAVGLFATGVEGASSALSRVQDVTDTVNSAFGVFTTGQQAAQGAMALFSGATKTATGIQWLWNAALTANPIGIVVAAIAALVGGLVLFFTKTETGRKIWEKFTDVAGKAWSTVKAAAETAWNWFQGTLWPGIKTGFQFAGTAFTTFRDLVGAVFGRIKDFMQPVLDIIGKIKDGIGGALGGVGNFLSNVPGLGFLGGHAGGGLISGPGSGTSDSIITRVSNHEFIVNAEQTRKNLPLLWAINSGNLPGFAEGGLVDSSPVKMHAQSMVGRKYSMESPRADCSSSMSELANVATGRAPRSSLMTTVNEGSWLASRGFIMGRGGPGTFRIGWYDRGGGANGHTAGTLPDGTNVESSGSTGMFVMGAGARGADASMFDKQAYLPMSPQGQTVGGDGSSLGGSVFGGGGSSGGGFSGGGSGGGGGGGYSGGGGGGDRRIGGAGGGSDKAESMFSQLKSIGEGGAKETFLPQGFSDPMSWPNVQSGMALLNIFGNMLGKPGQGLGDQSLIGDTRNLAPGELNPAITSGGSASLLGGAEGMMTQLTQGAVAQPGQAGGGNVDNSTHFHGNVDGEVTKALDQRDTARTAGTRTINTNGPLSIA